MPRRNCREGKQDHLLARLRPSQAMATGISSRRIDRDYSMIRRAAVGRAPRRLRDLSFQGNHSKIGSFHSPTYVPPSSRASTKFRRLIPLAVTNGEMPDVVLLLQRKLRDTTRTLFRRRSIFIQRSRNRPLDRQLSLNGKPIRLS